MQGNMSEQQSCAASADSPINAEEIIAKCSWFQVSTSSIFALVLWSYHVSGQHADAGRIRGSKCLRLKICCFMYRGHVMLYIHAQAQLG